MNGPPLDLNVVRRLRWPAICVTALMLLLFTTGHAPISDGPKSVVRHIVAILLIAATTWLLARSLTAATSAYLAEFDVSHPDNLRARTVHTQVSVITRILLFIVWSLGIAAILMTFPSVRQLGTSLLASAGIAGLVIGLAAQRVIGNFLAGVQIAITQPVRLDDAVVIAGEWGWIEEIGSTYVVVKIWDERRLVVPFSTLLEQPFQNWTRKTAALIGSVVLHADYRVPMGALREELHRVVEASPLWDGRVCVLQVVDAGERTVQLRALVSAKDSPTAWDLRCHVRELLIDFMQRSCPHALPLTRAELGKSAPVAREDEFGSEVPAAAAEPELGGLPGAPRLPEDPDRERSSV